MQGQDVNLFLLRSSVKLNDSYLNVIEEDLVILLFAYVCVEIPERGSTSAEDTDTTVTPFANCPHVNLGQIRFWI